MSTKSKAYSSFDDAVRDIPGGAIIGFCRAAVVEMPLNLFQAVAKQGAKNLTCLSNSTRGRPLAGDAPNTADWSRNGPVDKVICAFTPARALVVLASRKRRSQVGSGP